MDFLHWSRKVSILLKILVKGLVIPQHWLYDFSAQYIWTQFSPSNEWIKLGEFYLLMSLFPCFLFKLSHSSFLTRTPKWPPIKSIFLSVTTTTGKNLQLHCVIPLLRMLCGLLITFWVTPKLLSTADKAHFSSLYWTFVALGHLVYISLSVNCALNPLWEATAFPSLTLHAFFRVCDPSWSQPDYLIPLATVTGSRIGTWPPMVWWGFG